MGADREVFWALLALVGAFVALFAVMLWLRLARRAGEERRARDAEGPEDRTP